MRNVAAVGGQVVPLLAGDLARLAADAHRRVGEEAHPLRRPSRWIAISVMSARCPRTGASPSRVGVGCARARPRASRSARRVRRPARTLQVNALASWIETFGSPASAPRSLALSPGRRRRRSPSATAGRPGGSSRPVDRAAAACARSRVARASISARSVSITIQPPSSIPRSAASTGSISANISGCSSASHGRLRLIAARGVVLGEPEGRRDERVARVAASALTGLSGRSQRQRRRVAADARGRAGSSTGDSSGS